MAVRSENGRGRSGACSTSLNVFSGRRSARRSRWSCGDPCNEQSGTAEFWAKEGRQRNGDVKTFWLHSFAAIPLPNPFRGWGFRFRLATTRSPDRCSRRRAENPGAQNGAAGGHRTGKRARFPVFPDCHHLVSANDFRTRTLADGFPRHSCGFPPPRHRGGVGRSPVGVNAVRRTPTAARRSGRQARNYSARPGVRSSSAAATSARQRRGRNPVRAGIISAASPPDPG